MELKWVHAFTVLAQYLNYNKAAASLYISQPTLSKYIMLLEAEMGVHLFERTKRSVVLTEEGRRFLPKAQEIVRLMEEAVGEYAVQDSGESPIKEIRLGLDRYLHWCDFRNCCLSQAVGCFSQDNPGVVISKDFLDFPEMMRKTKSGELDAGITILYQEQFDKSRYINTKGISHRVICSDEMCLLVPGSRRDIFESGGPLSKALSGLKFFNIEDDTEYLVNRLNCMKDIGIKPTIEYVSDWDEILTCVLLQEGFGMISLQAGKKIACDEVACIPCSAFSYRERVITIVMWRDGLCETGMDFVSRF